MMSSEARSPSQRDRFIETARALSCDEDEAAFDEKLKAVVKPSLVKGGDPSRDGAESRGNRRKP